MERIDLMWMDPRMPGVKMIFAGILMFALVVMVLIYDLSPPGGNYYGSRGQGLVMMVFMGAAFIVAGYLEYQGKA
jgi:hypothetical protein